MTLDTGTLKPGDRVRIVIETEVRRVDDESFSGRVNSWVHNHSDIVSVERIPPPLAVGDWVKSPWGSVSQITAADDRHAIVLGKSNCKTVELLSSLTRIDPPEGVA